MIKRKAQIIVVVVIFVVAVFLQLSCTSGNTINPESSIVSDFNVESDKNESLKTNLHSESVKIDSSEDNIVTSISGAPVLESTSTNSIVDISDLTKNSWLCIENQNTFDDLSTINEVEKWNCLVEIHQDGDNMVVHSNGIPNHDFESTIGCCASEQEYIWHIPLYPEIDPTPDPVPDRGAIAVTVTGVPIFGPEEGPGGDAVALEHEYFIEDRQAIDLGICGGHSGPGGTYHYHYDSNCMHWHSDENESILDWSMDLIDSLKASPIIGFAFDGFPIYGIYGYTAFQIVSEMKSSYQLELNKTGYGGSDDWEYIEDLGNLDECNGHIGYVPDLTSPIYHYHATRLNGKGELGFPYFMNCYKGEVEELNFGDELPQVGPPMGERRPPPMGERRLR